MELANAASGDIILAVIIGYFSPWLVSLAVRFDWDSRVKFLLAMGVSAVAAAVQTLATGGDWSGYLDLTTATFTAQQAAFNLNLPLGGSVAVNEQLQAIGSPTDEDIDEDSPEDEEG